MPPRSKIEGLPEELRREVDRRLLENGFSNYVEMAEWLNDLGYEISKSSLGRHGKTIKDRVDMVRIATEHARVIVEEAPDDEGAMNEALLRLTQERLFQVMLAFDANKIEDMDLSKITRAIADLGRASINQKKWKAEVRRKAQAAAEAVEEIARGDGASDDFIATMKQKVLEIAA